MKKSLFAIFSLAILGGTLLYVTLLIKSEVVIELKNIEINSITFFMTRDVVENMYGLGSDETPGCFGCEMNFIYPILQLSGRYSETLDRKNDNRKSPKVKSITTIDKTVRVFDIGVGDTFKKAINILKSRGFTLQDNEDDYFYYYFYRDNVYIRLWVEDELTLLKRNNNYLGQDHEIIKGITTEYRIKKDEEVIY